MKKKLVFHLYCDENWENNIALKIHFACLKYYLSIFDEITIVIASNFEDNSKEIKIVKHKIIDELVHPNISIKAVKNTPYREAKTFYDEVLFPDYEGMVFFAHSKGYTNFDESKKYNKKSIIEWLLGCYWLSLNFVSEAERSLLFSSQETNGIFFGSFKLINDDGSVYRKSVYMGTFYWTNVRELKNHYSFLQKDIPKLSTRMSAEELPGNVCYDSTLDVASSHLFFGWFNDYIDGYGKCDGVSPETAIANSMGDDYENFCTFKKIILEKIAEIKQWN